MLDGGNGHHGEYFHKTMQNSFATQTSFSELTQNQKRDLLFMYQEEKLARDVYITLGELWNSRVFLNIQKSEQKHMNALKTALAQYQLETPIASDEIGVFENEKLQILYNKLIKKGEKSLQDALEVGILVEETDIKDLKERLRSAPSNIQNIYNRLLRGSYRHLRAFNTNLRRCDETKNYFSFFNCFIYSYRMWRW